MWNTIPRGSGSRYAFPRGESSRPLGPEGSAMRMCALAAMPPRASSAETAAADVRDERQMRRAR